jgi:hypothetical protein
MHHPAVELDREIADGGAAHAEEVRILLDHFAAEVVREGLRRLEGAGPGELHLDADRAQASLRVVQQGRLVEILR